MIGRKIIGRDKILRGEEDEREKFSNAFTITLSYHLKDTFPNSLS